MASPSIGSPIAVDQRRLQHVERPARERTHELVARGGRDHPVEARVGEAERLGGGMVSLGLCDRRRAAPRRSSSVACCGGKPGERHLEEDARVDELVQRDAVGLEHRRDRLADVAAACPRSACSRRRCRRPAPATRGSGASSRAAAAPSRSVGRLTPNSAASSCSVPRRSPGPQASRATGSAGSRTRPARWRRRRGQRKRRSASRREARVGLDRDLEQQRLVALGERRQHLVERLASSSS